MRTLLTPWQTVIFTNYGTVESALMGKLLGIGAQEVEKQAAAMGLEGIPFEPRWKEKGFVTVLRNNWDLLPARAIAFLLGKTEKELNDLLAEYDFLSIKLGQQPPLPDVRFTHLTAEEEENTRIVRQIVTGARQTRLRRPFDFFTDAPAGERPAASGTIGDRFVSNYCAKYSGSLLDDELSDYSEEFIARLAATGTNGVWLSDTLRNLAPFPFDESLSPDWAVRIANLKKLTERCAKYGVRVILYLNEPRSLPEDFFTRFPHLRGHRAADGTYCLCTSRQEVRDYLYRAVRSIAERVPDLYAVMTITMSENPTHCYSKVSHGKTCECPVCRTRTPQEVIAELNNLFLRALRDGNGKTRLIANVWAWAHFAGEDRREVFETIDLLDPAVDLMCVSEYEKPFTRGNVNVQVRDYSISVIGPGPFARQIFHYAAEKGHRIWAKMQINNSWECSAVPYLPVFDCMTEHVRRLKKTGVTGLMLAWSLGGYPGGALPLVNALCADDHFDENAWYRSLYGENAATVREAVRVFSEAFSSYPFSLNVIYYGAQNMGPGNLWTLEDDRESTMVCFTFGDLSKWTHPYGAEIYLSQMDVLLRGWEQGLALLHGLSGRAEEDMRSCAEAAYAHFVSARNLAAFSLAKRDPAAHKEELKEILASEEAVTRTLYGLIVRDARIGFEMTNHYMYNENLLLRKLIRLREIKDALSGL